MVGGGGGGAGWRNEWWEVEGEGWRVGGPGWTMKVDGVRSGVGGGGWKVEGARWEVGEVEGGGRSRAWAVGVRGGNCGWEVGCRVEGARRRVVGGRWRLGGGGGRCEVGGGRWEATKCDTFVNPAASEPKSVIPFKLCRLEGCQMRYIVIFFF